MPSKGGTTMPAIASISVKYGRKYQLRKDDWVNLEALVTLTVSSEEADLTDPHEVAAEAFRIARQAVREQGQALRKQLEELEQRTGPQRVPRR
jgi:hypothetical protein